MAGVLMDEVMSNYKNALTAFNAALEERSELEANLGSANERLPRLRMHLDSATRKRHAATTPAEVTDAREESEGYAQELMEAELLKSNLERLQPKIHERIEQCRRELERAEQDLWERRVVALSAEVQRARQLITDLWAARLRGTGGEYGRLLWQTFPPPQVSDIEEAQRRMAKELGIDTPRI